MKRLLLTCITRGLVITGVLWFVRCANQVAPGGGPQDTDPPQVIRSIPPNFSTFFDQREILLTFNEFIALKQIQQQVIISPPLKKMPDFRLRGKTLRIQFHEDFLPSTTYSIFFGNAIVDITEGNPLRDYLYVFSTGDHIDSLSLSGQVIHAFTLQPQENILVMLYNPKNDTIAPDSLPMKVKPLYVTKTTKEGMFQLRYLRNIPLKLFALKDLNNNYLYDLPEEEIAFEQGLVVPSMHRTANDTTVNSADTTSSAKLRTVLHTLRLFQQPDSIQRIVGKDTYFPPSFRLAFRYPLVQPAFEIIMPPDISRSIIEWNSNRDTLWGWLPDLSTDTIRISIRDPERFHDTLWLRFPAGADLPRRTPPTQRLSIRSSLRQGMTDPAKLPSLIFQTPISHISTARISMLTTDTDTIIGFSYIREDNVGRQFTPEVNVGINDEVRYQLMIPDSVFFDVFGQTHDTLRLNFRFRKESEYGNLSLSVTFPDNCYPLIVQLLDSRSVVLKQVILLQPGIIRFRLLEPALYRIRAIADAYPNGRWDTGKYPGNRQPEQVFFYPGDIQVRANWDLEENWILEW